jgi:hypothetical protein
VIPQGVIDEQTKHWGELLTQRKILALASRVHHLNRKGGVKNEIGMFVMLVKAAVGERIMAWEKQQSPSERERHAAFMVEMLRCAASANATPLEIGGHMRAARERGFPQLDEYVVQKLEAMGDLWERAI